MVVISPLLRPNFRRALSRGKVLACTVAYVVSPVFGDVDTVDVGRCKRLQLVILRRYDELNSRWFLAFSACWVARLMALTVRPPFSQLQPLP